MRKFRGIAAAFITTVMVAMSLFHLYTGGVQAYPAQIQRGVHLGLGLFLVFLLIPASKKYVESKLCLLYDVILALLTVVITVYYIGTIEAMIYRQGNPNQMDLILSAVAIFLVLEATRRTIGAVMAGIAVFFMLYAMFGQYGPELISHQGFSWAWVSSFTYLTTEGIYGLAIGVSSTFVFLFILFTSAIRESGGDVVIGDMAAYFLGRFRGGSAKASVFMGVLIGMISGSPVADAAAVGSLTIPLMKEKGFRPIFAAAITAISANGGAMMPPVMGAAAFIMVEFVNVPYWTICGAAILPALLYYCSAYMASDFEAARYGIAGIPKEERPDVKKVLRGSMIMVIPFAVLLYMLGYVATSPQKAAAMAFASLVLVYLVTQLLNRNMTAMKFVKYLIRTFEAGTKGMLSIIGCCACAGIIIGVVNLTGLGMQLSSILVTLSGGKLLPMLLLTMGASLIMGMGLPVTACYIILAVLAAPALVQAGLTPIAAHLFVFYFGIVSGLTPPVALTAYVAAGIAGTPIFRTGLYSFIICLTAFLIPYVWVYQPALIFDGPLHMTLITFVVCAISVVALTGGVMGYFLRECTIFERVILFISAVCIIVPETYSTIVGLVVLAVVTALQFRKNRSEKNSPVTAAGETST